MNFFRIFRRKHRTRPGLGPKVKRIGICHECGVYYAPEPIGRHEIFDLAWISEPGGVCSVCRGSDNED